MIMGIDQIRQTDLSRRQGPSIIQPKQQRTRTIAEQANIHQDRLFAASYFKEGAWKNELEGVDNTTPSTNQFIKFSNANSDPIAFIDKEKTDMNQQTGRMPNRLGLGINVFNALKVHPGILERVKYGGSTANPASVTDNVLAQLFGVEKIVVLKSIMNSASMGADEEMQYIGDPNAFLLAYATNAPSFDLRPVAAVGKRSREKQRRRQCPYIFLYVHNVCFRLGFDTIFSSSRKDRPTRCPYRPAMPPPCRNCSC